MCRRIRNSLKLEQAENAESSRGCTPRRIYKKKKSCSLDEMINNNNIVIITTTKKKVFFILFPLFFSAEAKLNPGLLRLVILLCLDEHTRLLLLPPSLFLFYAWIDTFSCRLCLVFLIFPDGKQTSNRNNKDPRDLTVQKGQKRKRKTTLFSLFPSDKRQLPCQLFCVCSALFLTDAGSGINQRQVFCRTAFFFLFSTVYFVFLISWCPAGRRRGRVTDFILQIM